MKKWYAEEYEFEIEVTGFLRGDPTERYCQNGYGICSKTMMMLYPIMEAVRSGGDMTKIGGDSKYTKTIVCPDGCVMFRLTAKPTGKENFYTGGFWKEP